MNYVPGDLRDQLAHVGYDVVQAGLVCGSGGNLSARIPDEDACWVTAGGAWLDRLSRATFAPVRIVRRLARDGRHAAAAAAPSRPASSPCTWRCTGPARTSTPSSTCTRRRRCCSTRSASTSGSSPPTTRSTCAGSSTVPFRLPGSTEIAALTAAMAADGTDCLVLSQHGCVVLARLGRAGPQAGPQPGGGRAAHLPGAGRRPAGQPARLPGRVPGPPAEFSAVTV